MKKIIKTIPVFLTVAMILCCSVFVPAMASQTDGDNSFLFVFNEGSVIDPRGQIVPCSGSAWSSYMYALPEGSYKLVFEFDPLVPAVDPVGNDLAGELFPLVHEKVDLTYASFDFSSGAIFTVDETMVNSAGSGFMEGFCMIHINSLSEPVIIPVDDNLIVPPEDDPVTPPEDDPSAGGNGVYYVLFDLLADFIYGDGAVLTGDQTLTLTMLATTAVLLVLAVPFLVVFFFLRLGR